MASLVSGGTRLPHVIPDTASISYDRFHGQRLLDKLGVPAAYPHGFGLSYTTFAIEHVTAGLFADGYLPVTIRVQDAGDRDGWHVVQVYGHRIEGERAGESSLLGFAAAAISARGSAEVTVSCSLDPWPSGTRGPGNSTCPPAPPSRSRSAPTRTIPAR